MGGLEKTLDCLTDHRRIKVIKPMYIEVLVALKLLGEGHKVEPFRRVFDILVDDEHRIEVKSGEMRARKRYPFLTRFIS